MRPAIGTIIRAAVLAFTISAAHQAVAEEVAMTQQEKQIAVGRILGAVAFCGFGTRLDQFKFGQRMKEWGLSSADRPQIEKYRKDTYSQIRSAISDPAAHESYCRESEINPLLIPVLRKFAEPSRNSDTSQQQEKISAFGDIMGLMDFCGVSVDGDKLSHKLYSMGVTSESMPAVQARSGAKRSMLELERGQLKGSSNICSELQSNLFVQQVKKAP
jgi:hypothetical protein